MMYKITLSLPGTTASVKHYVPVPDGCRVVGMDAVVNSVQTAGTALVKAGKKGATNVLYTANLGTTGANGVGNVAAGALNASATTAEKKQVFNRTTPVELDVQLVVAGEVGVTLYLDEFLIDQNA
jgi:hypothetical protein